MTLSGLFSCKFKSCLNMFSISSLCDDIESIVFTSHKYYAWLAHKAVNNENIWH